MKNLSRLLLILVVGWISVVTFKVIHQPEMIQKQDNLPVFHTKQDYSQNTYPGLVRLSKDGQFFCSGAVISDDYVLTAAHCLVDENGQMLDEEFDVLSLDGSNKVKVTAAGINQRADYALVKGSFKQYTKTEINLDPGLPMGDSAYIACGFPWDSSDICYFLDSKFVTYYDGFATGGRLYAGMSGGPVVDLNRVMIVAVNSAVGDGYVIIMPLIGLFETLGVKVVKDE